MTFKLTHSPLESERFGIRAGKLSIADLADVEQVMDEIRKNGYDYVSVRIASENLQLVQSLESHGFFLTDTLVYYKKTLAKHVKAAWSHKYLLRQAREADSEQIINVAGMSFQGYFGHYHSDSRFEKAKADEVYVDWIRRSCYENLLADVILVTEENGQITSFATVTKTDGTAEGVLFGVHPDHQGKGIYRELIRASMDWALENACTEIIYSTQITNLAVQKVWTREGCEMNRSYYTLHYWRS